MQFYKFSSYSAPKIFYFVDPDTCHRYSATSMKELIALILGYRQQNQLPPIPDLHAVVENYLCSLPEHIGACCPVTLHRSLFVYVKGGVALLKNLFYGEANILPQEQADQRAEQCLNCPANQAPDMGPFIKWTNDIAEASVGEHKSKHHDRLFLCTCCTCPLRAKVFYAGKLDLTEEEKKCMLKANPTCWQIK